MSYAWCTARVSALLKAVVYLTYIVQRSKNAQTRSLYIGQAVLGENVAKTCAQNAVFEKSLRNRSYIGAMSLQRLPRDRFTGFVGSDLSPEVLRYSFYFAPLYSTVLV